MGNSTPENTSQGPTSQQENYFFVEELSKVSLKGRRDVLYYWVDPRVYNAENQKYFNQFLKKFKISSFTSIQGLKSELLDIENDELVKVITAASLQDDEYRELNEDRKISQLFLFCGNQEKAKLLMQNFSKIKGFGLKSHLLVQCLIQFEKADKLDIAPVSLLSMLEEDRKTLNKYRLNYFNLISPHYRDKSKQDFVNLARALCAPQEEQTIAQFQQQYNLSLTGEASAQQTLRWAFRNDFFFRITHQLPKATHDVKKLAYLRLPFADLYNAIFHQHKKIEKMPQELYIVATLNEQELQKIQDPQAITNFIIFTSFVYGYTKKADAIKDFKEMDGKNGRRSFLFDVTFTKNKPQPQLDFGFVIRDNKDLKKNVIFNIYNFFRLEELQISKRTGQLEYGPLAEAFYKRADQTSKVRVSENETMLLRNYDYVQDIVRRDTSQAIILQMSGYFKEALEVYNKKVEFLREHGGSATELNKYIILRGDAYRLNEDYEQAQREYKSIVQEPDRLISLVHLLELYLKKGDDKMIAHTQQQLQKSNNLHVLRKKFPEEFFKAEYFMGLRLMKQNRFKDALKKFDNIKAEASLYFSYRFQGIPMVHDVFRSMASCQARLQNYKQSLNLLNSTKEWQAVCQGVSAGLLLTETMIQRVQSDMGDQKQAKSTKNSIQGICQNINLSQRKFLNNSYVDVSMGLNGGPKNVNSSMVVVNMNAKAPVNQSIVDVNLNGRPVAVDQSVVNVNLNQPVNVNQSLVNVNLDAKKPVNVNESIVNVNLDAKKPVNVNESLVNVNL